MRHTVAGCRRRTHRIRGNHRRHARHGIPQAGGRRDRRDCRGRPLHGRVPQDGRRCGQRHSRLRRPQGQLHLCRIHYGLLSNKLRKRGPKVVYLRAEAGTHRASLCGHELRGLRQRHRHGQTEMLVRDTHLRTLSVGRERLGIYRGQHYDADRRPVGTHRRRRKPVGIFGLSEQRILLRHDTAGARPHNAVCRQPHVRHTQILRAMGSVGQHRTPTEVSGLHDSPLRQYGGSVRGYRGHADAARHRSGRNRQDIHTLVLGERLGADESADVHGDIKPREYNRHRHHGQTRGDGNRTVSRLQPH